VWQKKHLSKLEVEGDCTVLRYEDLVEEIEDVFPAEFDSMVLGEERIIPVFVF
jgi:hypothetical protein